MPKGFFRTLQLLLEDGRCPVSEQNVAKVERNLINNQVPYYHIQLNDRNSILELNIDQLGMQYHVNQLRRIFDIEV
ncbi:hypothetical protein [Salibacterium aidingense]|uniref:hypothetical protein n=1 Tax=Salibacterium aidingense TaxID=384933 RepID=UPI00047DCF5E|nr:hypothetical protein [Salibacterium aidingense]